MLYSLDERARGPVVEIFSISFFANNARIMIIYTCTGRPRALGYTLSGLVSRYT